MAMDSPNDQLAARRQVIRDHTLADETELATSFASLIALSDDERRNAQTEAAKFVKTARENAYRSGMIDKFLQEYGLSSAEGVTLMRLAEALLRTPDAATANALIEDKIEAGNWAAHKGKSPFPLVNFSTRALMLTAAWLDDHEAKDPLRRIARATKEALDRLGEPVIRASVAQAMRIMGDHFVLGETIDEAMRRSRSFASKGYNFSFDMLGEAACTAADADIFFHDYQTAIAEIAKHCDRKMAAENPGISVKLSALHPRYEYPKKERVLDELVARTATLARQAKAANMGFNIDAEEADRLDLSLDVIQALLCDSTLQDWTGFGVVVQAYQRRAPFVLDWLAALARDNDRRIMVRLVKGAYWDAEIKRAQIMGLESYPVYTRKVLTDLSYAACARKILSSTDAFYPQFATHNALTATTVMEMAGDYDDYEFQRLHGMGEALHDSLLETGARSRIYAPVGGHKELLPYLVRRLLENGANSSFVNQLIDPDLSVDDIVADPITELAGFDSISNPHIPAPRDHLGGRLAAKGWDHTDPDTSNTLSESLNRATDDTIATPVVDGVSGGDGAPRTISNPAQKADTVGSVVHASENDVALACDAANRFAPEWRDTPRSRRGEVLRQAADLLEERGELFMTLAVREAGKTWPDAIAEVREAIDFLRYYADQGDVLRGEPIGVVACISPWNFPLAIFLGQITAALAAGNCVIAKPADQTPLIAFEGIRLLHDSGIPSAALHFVPGEGSDVGAALVSNPHVGGVIFTGSTQTAQIIKRTLVRTGRHDAALIAETGGLNAMIIDSTSLLETAIKDTVASAFQSAGQRCSACRIVCVQDDIFDRFEDMLTGAMAELRLGNPALLKTDVGPVIDQDAYANISAHLARLDREARLIAQSPPLSDAIEGHFIRPCAYEVSNLADLKTEIFGPVLHVVRFKSQKLFDTVMAINALGYGLTMGVHSRIDETMDTISRRARIGNLYINRNQIGAVVGVQPFGGEGLSGTGPKAGGPHYLPGLIKRPSVSGDAKFAFDDSALPAHVTSMLETSNQIYCAWNDADRLSITSDVASRFPELTSMQVDRIHKAATITTGSDELPGPTGEANTLKQRGRGVALCLGGSETPLHVQALTALAAGNIVICAASTECHTLKKSLEAAGAPDGIITLYDGLTPSTLLRHDNLRMVVSDSIDRAQLEHHLSERTGAIIAIVSTHDELWRLCTERTLSVNTTAAGGDVRLLALSD